MPVSPAPTTASHTPREAPKLRSSCGGCGTAKVKCDRGRPQCIRCVTLNLTCAYQISRKAGKPPRKRPGPELAATAEKRICTSLTTSSSNNHPNMDFGETQNISRPAQSNYPHIEANIFPSTCGNSAVLNINEQNLPFYSLPHEEWPRIDNLGSGLEFPSTSTLEPANAVRMTFELHESHSCPRESYEIFRDLICPSPYLHAPESNSITVSTQLDQVLHFSRNAVNRLSRLLKCPCAKSGHRAMVHASIISRILIWYQQAAGWTGSSSWGPRPSIPTDSPVSLQVSSPSPPLSPSGIVTGTSTTSSPSLVQTTGFAVEHVPISIGTFNIEDPNMQVAFRSQLILSELKKTAHLIDMFISQDSDECPASGLDGLDGLNSHLGTWLRNEYSRTVKTLTSRLGVLNGSPVF